MKIVDAIALAERQFPRLCTNGLYPYPGTAQRQVDAAQVETAVAFLSTLKPTKTARVSSGSLKHHVEAWGQRHDLCSYISRGALTVAAVGLGLVVRSYGPWFSMDPHVLIGVSRNDLHRMNAAYHLSEAYRR